MAAMGRGKRLYQARFNATGEDPTMTLPTVSRSFVPHPVVCAAALLACAGTVCAQSVVGSPQDLTAQVADYHNPGGTVFTDQQTVTGAFPNPKQSAEYLYLAPIGQNFSGHSTSIHPAFASSLAESDGNGGVGVSSWIAGMAAPGLPGSTDELVAAATWVQTFTYNGALAASISLHFEIPALTVGLIGVAPNRDAVSKTESARTAVILTSIIDRADGTQAQGGSFEYGIRADEYQIPLGPGVYENFADISITNDIFQNTLTNNGDTYNPEWTLAAVKGNVTLGVLGPGDSISYVYTISASGTTLGGEHGYYAFIGDPFGIDVVSGNLLPVLGPVPEPPVWALAVGGLAWLGWRRRRSR
jgi:hypothetical protein